MKMDNLSVFMMGHNWTESVFISKLCIPSTEKELLRKAIWADKKWAGFWQNKLTAWPELFSHFTSKTITKM